MRLHRRQAVLLLHPGDVLCQRCSPLEASVLKALICMPAGWTRQTTPDAGELIGVRLDSTRVTQETLCAAACSHSEKGASAMMLSTVSYTCFDSVRKRR